MSAYIMSDSAIFDIAQNVQPNNIGQFADMLKRINIQSVNYRYNENTRFRKVKFPDVIQYSILSKSDVIRLIECWQYQACEMHNSLEFDILDGYLINWINDNS